MRNFPVLLKPVIVLASALSAGLVSSGCTTAHAFVPVAGAVTGVAVSYTASSISHGPRVSFVNDSNFTVSIRYWCGKRDSSAAHGVADVRTDDHMNIRALPGDFFITQVGRPWWPTSMSDAVIYARVETEAADGTRAGPIWLELEQPQPFKFSASGCSAESLVFKRFGGGKIVPLAPDRWIDGNNGPFPLDHELAAH